MEMEKSAHADHVATKVKISMSDSKEKTLALFIDLTIRNSIYTVAFISK